MYRYILSSLFIFCSYFSYAESEWEIVVQNDDYVLNCVDFFDHKTGLAVGDDGVVLKTINGGISWDEMTKGSFGDIKLVDVLDENIAIACGTGFIIQTKNGGRSWIKTFTGSNEEFRFLKFMTHFWGQHSGRAVAAGNNGLALISNSNGGGWHAVNTDPVVNGCDILYLGTNYYKDFGDTVAGILCSSGQDYQTRNNFTSRWGGGRTQFEPNEVDVIHCYHNFEGKSGSSSDYFGMGYSSDGAFIELRAGAPRRFSKAGRHFNGGIRHFFPGKTLWIAVGAGGYIYQIIGPNWGLEYSDEADLTARDWNWCDFGADPENSDNIAIISVGDGVIGRKTFGEHPDWKVGAQIPMSNNLQNLSIYPNPTSGKTNISYQLSKQESVSISTFDVQGHQLDNFPLETQPAGSYSLPIGALYKPGIYIVKLRVGDTTLAKRLVKQ